jgi:hypothetical protein
MSLFINVLLLGLGFIGAISAIGGETWIKGAPLRERITRRGWISITCLILTLSLGIAKEYRSQRQLAAVEYRKLAEDAHWQEIRLSAYDELAKRLKILDEDTKTPLMGSPLRRNPSEKAREIEKLLRDSLLNNAVTLNDLLLLFTQYFEFDTILSTKRLLNHAYLHKDLRYAVPEAAEQAEEDSRRGFQNGLHALMDRIEADRTRVRNEKMQYEKDLASRSPQ